MADRRSQLLRRAFTLSGVLPLGAFLVVHAALNARALAGEQAFLHAADACARLPGLALLEALVLAPLLFHALFGLWLVLARRPLAEPSLYPPALRAAMRATGVVALGFVALHLAELRFRTPGARPDGGALLTLLAAQLSAMAGGVPWRGVVYLVGSAAVCFHFAAGLWGAVARTPRGEGDRARRRTAWWAAAVGATLWLVFADVVVFHATGSRLFGGAPQDEASTAPCPAPSASTAPPAPSSR